MDRTTPFQPWAANDGVKKDSELVDDAKHHRENVNHPKHTQTASYDKESAVAASNVPGPSSVAGSGGDPAKGMEGKMDSAKIASMQQFVENSLSPEARQRVSQLLETVDSLSGTERLLLYLRLPTGVPPHDPLKQPVNPLGSRAELQQTVTWIQTHLEVDPDVSLPKQDVYEEYITHCMSSNMKPLSTADFGKVMKQVYPSVRPRRLGTRGNSRYCYAGLRKKIKLEVPQLPDLGESSQESSAASRETERVVCDWAETKFGVKFNRLSELSRHLLSATATALRPADTPPPLATLSQTHGPSDDPASRQLMKQLKRKIQTHGTPGRPKKYKGQEAGEEAAPSTSYGAPPHPPPHPAGPGPAVKHEGEPDQYEYPDTYMYDARAPYYRRAPPVHDYRPDPYAFEPAYAPRDLTLPPADAAHNLPINLSSDASLDLSTERAAWQRRRPPEPPPPPPAPRPLPGKKLILEAFHSETATPPRAQPPPPPPPADDFPREYLPKKMRAAEIMGGKLAAARHAPSTSADASVRPEGAFLEDPKNVSSRSKSTAAALAREEQEAAEAPTRPAGAGLRAPPRRARSPPGEPECCALGALSLRSGVICQERHSEILTRERVISICNIDKHDLDDYLNEGSSQENEEELLHYFHRDPAAKPAPDGHAPNTTDAATFLETGLDPQDDHSQGKNEKICQLRELLAKNLKSGSSFQAVPSSGEPPASVESKPAPAPGSDGAFKQVSASSVSDIMNGPSIPNPELNRLNSTQTNGTTMPIANENGNDILMTNMGTQLYNGNGHHNIPQSPTTRTQAYDFVPISDGCHSPRTFNSKSPPGFGHRGLSPVKAKPAMPGGSLQTSPVPASAAASPFVSPRNTPVPRSRLCPRPIPKHNGRKRCQPFAIPNEQKFIAKSACAPGMKYCQPMSAPPSPNIVSCHYKNQLFQCATGLTNGGNHAPLNFMPSQLFRESACSDAPAPLSADPLSNEVSQFFQESLGSYRAEPDAFRSQSVPLQPGMHHLGMLGYNKTPVGSVPPTPVPNEFCDFGSLADTCDISKAGLNPETLDKIYDAIDSSNDVLAGETQTLLATDDSMANGCDLMPEQQILTDELNSLIPGEDLLDRGGQFNQTFAEENAADNVEDFLKRTNSIEFDLSDLVTDKNKFYMSRSVPSTPLPSLKRAAPALQLQLDPRRARELFAADSYGASNGISSKSVPSTPQLVEEKNVFNYGNRDFLINGNSVETCGSNPVHVVESQELASPLHEILREDMLEPLNPASDLLADLDKIEPPYVDI